jgi:hypothetical protein
MRAHVKRHEEARSNDKEVEANIDGSVDVWHCFCGRIRTEANSYATAEGPAAASD